MTVYEIILFILCIINFLVCLGFILHFRAKKKRNKLLLEQLENFEWKRSPKAKI